jgi:hypothetical protein
MIEGRTMQEFEDFSKNAKAILTLFTFAASYILPIYSPVNLFRYQEQGISSPKSSISDENGIAGYLINISN